MEIRGERVLLRAFNPEEHDAFVESRRAGGEGVAVMAFDEDEMRRRVAESGRMTDRGLLFAIDVDGRAVGEIQAYRNALPDGVFGIGIGLFDDVDRGRGIGTEAVKTLTRHLFDELEARRVEAGTHTGNAAMIALLERLGFVREGVLRRFFPSRDGGMDCAVYAMTRDDWGTTKDTWMRAS